MANIVVSQIVINRDQHRAAKTVNPLSIHLECIGRQRDQLAVEMDQAGHDHGGHCDDRPNAQDQPHLADNVNAT